MGGAALVSEKVVDRAWGCRWGNLPADSMVVRNERGSIRVSVVIDSTCEAKNIADHDVCTVLYEF